MCCVFYLQFFNYVFSCMCCVRLSYWIKIIYVWLISWLVGWLSVQLLFAFVPPPCILNGWLSFCVSLALIGLLTAIVGDLAAIFGCLVGLKVRQVCRIFTNISAITPTHTHTHTRLTALCPGLPGWAGTRKVQPIWILLKQDTVSGSGISWAVCKSAPCSRQITMPAPTTQFFTGRMPFLLPNQQCHSIEGIYKQIQLSFT